MSRELLTIWEAWSQASSFFREKNILDPESAARLLLEKVLEMNPTELYLSWKDPFPKEKLPLWQQWVQRKGEREPAQYIIGEQAFYDLSFKVDPSVLIPRPETEILVEQIIKHGKRLFSPSDPPTLADIGTGSGAIAVTVAVHCPHWNVIATDFSGDALRVARLNASHHQVQERIVFCQGDLLEPLLQSGMSVDILASNLPYIPSRQIPHLEPEVRCFEPLLALDGGEDGLVLYRRLLEQVKKMPSVPRLVGFEIGWGQGEEMAAMLKASGCWERVRIISDYAGIPRHVLAYSETIKKIKK